MDVDIAGWDIWAMRCRACAAAFVLLLLAPQDVWAAGAHGRTRATAHAAGRPARNVKRAPPPSALATARAQLAALARDKNRRRFHHNWEKAIAALLRAARGPDRAAALHEAAQARYALYRWSADEADREEALRLATRAGKLGVPEARALAQAIRREAGEDERPAPPHRRPAKPTAAVAQTPPPAAATPAAPDDEETDPALDRVMAALAPAEPSGEAGGSSEAASEPSGPARVTEVKAWSSADYTRVVVYLSHWVKWQQQEIPAAGDQRRRLAVDLSPALLEGRTLERAVGGGKLARVRAAQYSPEAVRVVLDLDGDDQVHVFRMDDPPRLVLDLAAPQAPAVAGATPGEAPAAAGTVSSGRAGPEAQASAAEGPDTAVTLPPRTRALLEGGSPPPAAAPAPAPEEAAPVGGEGAETDRPIRRIVVDAGHGGHDPGAIGPSRLREKDVTLAMAKKLAARLRGYGFEVVLTRSDDRFLALEERTALANTHKGDLFVSVHANANPRRSWSGIETYFLNVTDDRYARRLAARENGVDLSVAGDLARILTDLDAKASADASQRLAHLVQREVCGGVRARVGEVRDLGVKNALFYVLLGARMPAVLVETGFISNRAEERRLASARYQDEVAAGIARAVKGFAADAQQIARQ
jgi:N-acetylmuramoyl-L-alanine amidase